MDKNHLYFNYLNEDSKYFVRNTNSKVNNSKAYEVENIPSNCLIHNAKGSPWLFYYFKNQVIKDQGWKIHISATMNNAQETLSEISELLFRKEIPFKHLINERSMLNVNSKNGNRTSSGKFITIYPQNDEIFLELLDSLYEIVKNKEAGPYILSDKCWNDSNVFYRYGGFKTILNENGQPCIKDPDGNLVPDQRTPYYQVPDFMKDFDELLDSKNNLAAESDEEKQKLANYKFKRVFRFTNGGGIYLGERVSDQSKVVIKEARPKVGLDGKKRDAVERLNIEYENLTKLADVAGVVNVIDYFKSWKHYFLVEEYVEGTDLKTWISVKYPFHRRNSIDAYKNDIRKILQQVIKVVEEMHNKGVGMGDLQPANIMIDEDLNVKLIDFESAAPIDDDHSPSLFTMGFANKVNKNHRERDWFAVKKVARYCFLPVGPISELDEKFYPSQNRWIQKEYGQEIYEFIKEIEAICDKHLTLAKTKQQVASYSPIKNLDKELKTLINGFRAGLINNLTTEERLIYGDIRQFELPAGEFNVLTGGAGAALALARTGEVNSQVHDWVKTNLLTKIDAITESGLFSGKAGIATALFELGYTNEARILLKSSIESLNYGDVSLRTGLSGIGLNYLSMYIETKDQQYFAQSKIIAEKIKDFFTVNELLKVNDWAGVPVGLIDGWSGVSLFFSTLYAVTYEQEYLDFAKTLLDKDLQNTRLDESTEILQTIDSRDRLLPYLSGGSIGIGIAIWYLNHVSGLEFYVKELQSIINLKDIRCTFSGGLFDGFGGFLLLSTLINMDTRGDKMLVDQLEKLSLYYIKDNDELLFSGNFGYRLSHDVYSGNAGIILALNAILKSNPLIWIPVVNVEGLVKATNFKNSQLLLVEV